ncbi:hypothetical protein ACQRWP_26065 [Micromonospora trifolii]|uniref:hypothetical protein n=1 Tax=Micromonospora trifolii TaxID=2911208 RepID=UPI003D2F4D70
MISEDLEIVPLVRVSQIRFGASRAEVRSLAGGASGVGRRSEWARSLMDEFEYRWLRVDYSDEDRVEFVEVIDGRSRVHLNGVQLMPSPVREALQRLDEAGMTYHAVDGGFAIDGTGVELYAPGTTPDSSVEAVSAWPYIETDPEITFFEGAAEPLAEWNVESGAIAGIGIGESRASVRDRLGSGMASTLGPDESMDRYWGEGLIVRYDSAGRSSEVVAVDPALPSLNGIGLLGRTYADVRADLTNASIHYEARAAEIRIPGLKAHVLWKKPAESALAVAVSVRAS